MMEQVKSAGARLKDGLVAVRGMLLWALFKLVQATVAALFSFVIVAQAVTSGIMRLFSDSEALKKVQTAQLASNAAARAKMHQEGFKGSKGNIQIRAVAADPSGIKPQHIFVDPSKGEHPGSSSSGSSSSSAFYASCTHARGIMQEVHHRATCSNCPCLQETGCMYPASHSQRGWPARSLLQTNKPKL
jgi:hypothetical protein